MFGWLRFPGVTRVILPAGYQANRECQRALREFRVASVRSMTLGLETIWISARLRPSRHNKIKNSPSDEVRINSALRFILRDADRANAGLKTPNDVFGGRLARDLMSEAGGA